MAYIFSVIMQIKTKWYTINTYTGKRDYSHFN